MGVIYLHGVAYGKGSGGGGGGTSDYNELTNKPRINNITLNGNKTTENLGLVNDVTTYMESDGSIAIGMVSNDQINNLFN